MWCCVANPSLPVQSVSPVGLYCHSRCMRCRLLRYLIYDCRHERRFISASSSSENPQYRPVRNCRVASTAIESSSASQSALTTTGLPRPSPGGAVTPMQTMNCRIGFNTLSRYRGIGESRYFSASLYGRPEWQDRFGATQNSNWGQV